MDNIPQEILDEITREVEKEFPEDPALQQVHIARKIISYKAKLKGLTFIEYINFATQKKTIEVG